MKQQFLILLILVAAEAKATNYYISNAGNDANNGRRPRAAWRTITKLNSYFHSLLPGDSVFFRRGDEFYGKIDVAAGGNASGQLYIGSYGKGPKPVITGLTTITNFTYRGGHIYEASCRNCNIGNGADNTGQNTVVINGRLQPVGRYPNTGYLTGTRQTATSLYDASLTGKINWTGAQVVVRKYQHLLPRYTISNQSDGTITYRNPAGTPGFDGYGYFIQRDYRTLDTTNEWYFNPADNLLYVYSTKAPRDVKVSTIDTLIYVHNPYVTLDNLTFTGGNQATVLFYQDGSVIQNCTVLNSGQVAIAAFGGNGIKVLNNSVINSNNTGIIFLFKVTHGLIKGNYVKNTAIWPGMGQGGDNNYIGISVHNSTSNLVENNEVDSTGFHAISFDSGDSVTVHNNYVHNYCTDKGDGAGIYCYTGNAKQAPAQHGSKIIGNLCLNGSTGSLAGTNVPPPVQVYGIYLDGWESNIIVDSNTCANNPKAGLMVNSGNNVLVRNNIFYSNGEQEILIEEYTALPRMCCNVYSGNTIMTGTSGLAVHHQTEFEDYNRIGTFTNNKYISYRTETGKIRVEVGQGNPKMYNKHEYSITRWKAMGKDAGSTGSIRTLPARLDYNISRTPKKVSLGKTVYKTAAGIPVSNSQPLQPYRALVLINTEGAIAPSPSGGKVQRKSAVHF